MRHLDAETLFESTPDVALSTFAQVDQLKDFMPGISGAEVIDVADEDEAGLVDFEVDVKVSLGFFGGRMRAAVEVDRSERTVKVNLLNGPVKSARALIAVTPGETGSHVRIGVDYQPPIGPLDLLIGRLQAHAVTRVLGVYAARAKALQAAS